MRFGLVFAAAASAVSLLPASAWSQGSEGAAASQQDSAKPSASAPSESPAAPAPASVAPAASSPAPAKASEEAWLDSVRPLLVEGGSVPGERFDELFTGPYFQDPMDAMAGSYQRVLGLLKADEAKAFKNAFRSWFSGRIDTRDLPVEVRWDRDLITVKIAAPSLQKDSASVEVRNGRIRAAFTASLSHDVKSVLGKVVRKYETVETFEKFLPVPAGADPDRARVALDADAVVISFPRRKRPWL